MRNVQYDHQLSESFEEIDSQFPNDLGRIVSEKVKTRRKKSLLKKNLRLYENEMLESISELF